MGLIILRSEQRLVITCWLVLELGGRRGLGRHQLGSPTPVPAAVSTDGRGSCRRRSVLGGGRGLGGLGGLGVAVLRLWGDVSVAAAVADGVVGGEGAVGGAGRRIHGELDGDT